MFQEIKSILLAGGTVQFPWKRSVKDWFSELKISVVHWENKPRPFLDGEPFVGLRDRLYHNTLELDEAIRTFGRAAFGKRNIALAFEGIRKHNLTDKDFEYLSVVELKNLVREYWAKFYEEDYPFIQEFEEPKDVV